MARTVDVRSVDGSVSGSVALDDALFGIEPHVAVMHQVVIAQLAAARAGTQSTKTRAEVSGGGKKPFRQKGTGRARQGSTRAPHWSGGGVALGPKPRSYKQRTPRKMIQLALRSALSDRAGEDRVMVVAEWPWTTPKTAEARRAIEALELDGRVLVVLDRDRDEIAYKAFRNLPLVQMILTGELNAYDVLCNDWIVFSLYTLPGTTSQAQAELVAEVEAVVEEVVAEIEQVVEEVVAEIEQVVEVEELAEAEEIADDLASTNELTEPEVDAEAEAAAPASDQAETEEPK